MDFTKKEDVTNMCLKCNKEPASIMNIIKIDGVFKTDGSGFCNTCSLAAISDKYKSEEDEEDDVEYKLCANCETLSQEANEPYFALQCQICDHYVCDDCVDYCWQSYDKSQTVSCPQCVVNTIKVERKNAGLKEIQ